MQAALVIAAKDLRERIRNRTALIVAIIAPFGLAAIFSLILPSGGSDFRVRYALADLDHSQVSAAFQQGALAGLVEGGFAAVLEVESEEAARQAIEAEEVDAAFVLPSGFGDSVQTGRPARIEVIGSVNAPTAIEVARAVAEAFAAELEAVRLSVAVVLDATGGPSDPNRIAELAARAVQSAPPVRIEDAVTDRRELGITTFYAASMAIFFLFFTAQFGALSLLTERRQGTLPRLLAAPVSPWMIILGKAIGSFVLGIVAMAVLAVASSLLLGAQWGNPLGAAALIVAAVIAAMGITALITTLARTEEQAGGWNSIAAVTMAILGGTFFPLSQGPEILGQLSLFTPHAWFLRGLGDLSGPGGTPADLLPALAALLGFGVVTGTAGLARAQRLLVGR